MERLQIIAVPSRDRHDAFARHVRAGFTSQPKHLSCCFFYDAEGSALFEAICDLPEYYLTRAERDILQERAAAVAARLPRGARLVELGSGNSAKTRLLIEAFLRRQQTLHYVPLDICGAILQETARELLRAYPQLTITAIAAEYHEGLRHLDASSDLPKLILWLGSNVGNFHRPEAAEFLGKVRRSMTADDRLLLGVDLRKGRPRLAAAYDDSRGVTAAFNLNLLERINRELGGRFERDAFYHRAVYNELVGRIEMYLVSNRAQTVRIDALDLDVSFAAGEPIHTENSYKYSFAEIEELAGAAGLQIEERWLDRDGLFSMSLLGPTCQP